MEDDDEIDTTLLVETILNAPDVSYAALYSPASDFMIYAMPIGIILAAIIFGLVYLAPHGTADKAWTALHIFATLGSWAQFAIVIGILLYPLYKIWSAADQSKITHHLFTKDGIELVRESGNSILPWSNLSRVIETPKGFLFYQGARVAAFLPRRFLQGDAEIAIIRKFVSKYVSNARLLA
jgi:hypothetical protein